MMMEVAVPEVEEYPPFALAVAVGVMLQLPGPVIVTVDCQVVPETRVDVPTLQTPEAAKVTWVPAVSEALTVKVPTE